MRRAWVPLLMLAACTSDPVLESRTAALGSEDPAVPVGEDHRPGQPCVTCHQPSGASDRHFALAGTVLWGPVKLQGVAGARVEILDARPGPLPPRVVTTNCAGNFFIDASDDLTFPLRVRVVAKGKTRDMRVPSFASGPAPDATRASAPLRRPARCCSSAKKKKRRPPTCPLRSVRNETLASRVCGPGSRMQCAAK
jgi:hypothetical protein